jgi:hypothetical protein
MKKTISMMMAAAAIALAACEKAPEAVPEAGEEGVITVSIAPQDGPETRAVSAYTAAQTYETQLNSVQVFVFGSDGKINAYKNIGTSTSASLSVTSGAKTVYAVANCVDLSYVGTLTDLEAKAFDLSANSTTASKGFLMAGKASCTVSSGTTNCSVAISRLAARVALQSVTNSLPASYGALKVERVFLCNVVGNQNIGGNATQSAWYNKEGRKDEGTRDSAHIIDGSTYTASCPELTFKSVGTSVNNGASLTPSTPYLFYGYANSVKIAPAGFSSTFSGQRTVLVVAATVDSKLYYYPVVLDESTIERNTTYTVGLTITGLGSEDPNKPVEKGSFSVSVSVDGWKTGATYDETI